MSIELCLISDRLGLTTRRDTYDSQVFVIRVKNLPADVTPQMVLDIFKKDAEDAVRYGDIADPSGICVPYANGRTTGEAFVVFPHVRPSTGVLTEFLISRVRQNGLTFEVCKSNDLIARMFPPTTPNVRPVDTHSHPMVRMSPHRLPTEQAAVRSNLHWDVYRRYANLGHIPNPMFQPVDPSFGQYSANLSKNCLLLRGIPQDANLDEICDFLRGYVNNFRREDMLLFIDASGLFNGFVFVPMINDGVARMAQYHLNLTTMQHAGESYYIEVRRGSRYEIFANCILPNSRPVLATSYVPPAKRNEAQAAEADGQ